MGNRTRAAGAAHRSRNHITRLHFRQPPAPPKLTPEAIAEHEAGHAVLDWLYGGGFVRDPVVEMRPAASHIRGMESVGITHHRRLTAPTHVGLTRFDAGALARLAMCAAGGAVAEQTWWETQGVGYTLPGFNIARDFRTAPPDRFTDFGECAELSFAAAFVRAELHRTGAEGVLLPPNWLCMINGAFPALYENMARHACTAQSLLAVPMIAAAHRACVEHLLRTRALPLETLDAACKPIARRRQPPTATIAATGNGSVPVSLVPGGPSPAAAVRNALVRLSPGRQAPSNNPTMFGASDNTIDKE